MVSQQVGPLSHFVKSEHKYFRKIGCDLKYLDSFKSKIILYSVLELKEKCTYAVWKVLSVTNSIGQIDNSFKPQLDRCVLVCKSF